MTVEKIAPSSAGLYSIVKQDHITTRINSFNPKLLCCHALSNPLVSFQFKH